MRWGFQFQHINGNLIPNKANMHKVRISSIDGEGTKERKMANILEYYK